MNTKEIEYEKEMQAEQIRIAIAKRYRKLDAPGRSKGQRISPDEKLNISEDWQGGVQDLVDDEIAEGKRGMGERWKW